MIAGVQRTLAYTIMGNESSIVVDEETPPQTLEGRNIEAVAKYILEKDVRRIVVMVRALLWSI